MPLMQWSKHFETGIELVDSQHRQLVDLINRVAPHLAESGTTTPRDVRALLDQLAEYAVMHFQSEETLMEAGGIDREYLAHHRQNHAAFVDEVSQMIHATQTAGEVSGSQLLRFLTSWLTFHILSDDQDMAARLPAHADPDERHERNRRDGASANAALNEALVDLFGVVTQRNQRLKALNDALIATQSELALANQQLEARVADRTFQLKQAYDTLETQQRELIASLDQVRQTQTQLIQSEKMAAVGQLAAGVAHEINNPIGFITSNFGSLASYTKRLLALVAVYQEQQGSLPASSTSREIIRRASEAADLDYLRQDLPALINETSHGLARVKRIVSDLLDFATINEDGGQLVDVNAILQEALELAGKRFGQNVAVQRELCEIPAIRGDAQHLRLVFTNLLTNAAQAIESAGTVTVRSGVSSVGGVGGDIRVEISDTGTGIPEAIRHRIFEPFYTTKPVGEATGLGLAMAWEVIKRHHGHIDLQSSPETGTKFIVSLPAAPQTAAPTAAAE